MFNHTPSYRLENLTKMFPGVLAVDGASYEVREGEIHGIIGKNGAGKSVTVNMVAGILRPTSGALWIGDQAVDISSYSPVRAHELGVSLIPQEPLFALDLNVSDNIFLGNNVQRRLGFVNHKAMHERTAEIAERLSVNVSPRQRMKDVPLEDQQLLAFGKTLFVQQARAILLDEITASLPRQRKDLLLQFLRQAVDETPGLSFTLISHHINEIIEFCDRVTVMRDGKAVATLNVAETNKQELAAYIVGDVGEVSNGSNGTHTHALASRETTGVVLEVEGMQSESTLQNVSFEVARGEVVGFAGLDGSGKDEVMEALAGLQALTGGSIKVNGRAVRIRTPQEAFKFGLAYLPKKREEQAVIHNRSVEDNILICIYPQLRTPLHLIDRARARNIARDKVEELDVKTPGLNVSIDNLSGGNRQKVVLNRVGLTMPVLFILNEPTRGVDLATKPEILRMVRSKLAVDSGVIISSESEEELVDSCDRILVFYRGEICRVLHRNTDDFTVAEVYKAIQGIGLS